MHSAFPSWSSSSKSTVILGCGNYLEYKDELGLSVRVTLVDIDSKQIRKLKKHGYRASIMDLTKELDLPNDFYEQLICGDVIEHLGKVEVFAKECYRITKPGGRLVLGCPLFGYWRHVPRLLLGWTSPMLSDGHVRLFTKKDLLELFEKQGFNCSRVELRGINGYGLFWFDKVKI